MTGQAGRDKEQTEEMRQRLKIFLGILAAALLAGCAEVSWDEPEVPDALTFSVSVPAVTAEAATRSFSSEAIKSLWVLVFDENGFFVECRKAEPVAPAAFGTDMNVEYKFQVKLQASVTKRILHFVANYDFDSNPVSYGSEYYVISHLSVSGGQDAYWQRVVLKTGIYLNESWDRMSDEEQAKLVKIPLVRNFASVQVTAEEGSRFELEGYALWNVPDRGCVAPCVMSQNSFAVYAAKDTVGDSYSANPWVSRSYSELTLSYDGTSSDGFKGFLPYDAGIVDTDPAALDFTTDEKFMYERPFSGDVTNTAVIVKGKYNGGSATYYKIDLVEMLKAGLPSYYNVLRNFKYSIKILDCSSDGYATAAEAAEAPASNNFTSSIVTADLTNISDGTSRLLISYTDTTIVTSSPFQFRYKYIPDLTKPNEVDNTKIKAHDKATWKEMDPSVEGDVIKTYTSDDAGGWRVVTITPRDPSGEVKTQSVVFYEPNEGGTHVKIARTVTYRLREPYTMQLGFSPATVSTGVGLQLTLNLKIPTGLSYHLFPLEFKVESEANSLTPDASKSDDTYRSGYMSTWYGDSMIPSKSGKRSFGFTKTVSYSEYLSMASTEGSSYKIIPCAFKTTKSTSATTVWVRNKYFYFGDGQSTATFGN